MAMKTVMLLAFASSALGVNEDLPTPRHRSFFGKRLDVENPSSNAEPSVMRRESQAKDDPIPEPKVGRARLMRREGKRTRAASQESNPRVIHSDKDRKDDASEDSNDMHPSLIEQDGEHPSVLLEVASSTASDSSTASKGSPGDLTGDSTDLPRRRRRYDCTWTEWGTWGECNMPCGGGIQQKERATVGPYDGGVPCSDAFAEYQECNLHTCDVNCEWNSWGAWGPCSQTCGGGTRERMRDYLPYTDQGYNPEHCPDSGKTKTGNCNAFACPVPCSFGQWGLWGGCSATCGGGDKIRSREQTGPLHDGAPCEGGPTHTDQCNAFACPTDCTWNMWGGWGECSRTCGGGERLAQRTMMIQATNGGQECLGSPARVHECNLEECPSNCKWSEWHDPGPCTKTCGGGVEHRHRSILIEAAHNGMPCTGPATDVNACNVEPCPQDCIYQEWQPFGECSASCGGGTHWTIRNFTQARHGGISCNVDNDTKEEECNLEECPTIVVKGGTRRQGAVLAITISLALVILQ